MSNIDYSKFPGLNKLQSHIPKTEQPKPKKSQKLPKEPTEEGIKLVERMTEVFGKPEFFYKIFGATDNAAHFYISSLRRRKRHNKAILLLLDIFQKRKANDDVNKYLDEVMQYGYMAKQLNKNRGIKRDFLKGKITPNQLKEIFNEKNS